MITRQSISTLLALYTLAAHQLRIKLVAVVTRPHRLATGYVVGQISWGRMHDADVSASLRLKLTYDGLAH